jgi:hypothetical protein
MIRPSSRTDECPAPAIPRRRTAHMPDVGSPTGAASPPRPRFRPAWHRRLVRTRPRCAPAFAEDPDISEGCSRRPSGYIRLHRPPESREVSRRAPRWPRLAGRFSAVDFGSHYPRFTTALYHVNLYELDHDRPMVGALAVVNTRSSIKGFAGVGREWDLLDGDSPDEERAFWQDQRDRAIKVLVGCRGGGRWWWRYARCPV